MQFNLNSDLVQCIVMFVMTGLATTIASVAAQRIDSKSRNNSPFAKHIPTLIISGLFSLVVGLMAIYKFGKTVGFNW